MTNENIGKLGRAFIAERTDLGVEFDEAWAEWEKISKSLHFILIDCPEVRYYDDWRVVDRDERLRIRRLAKEKVGRHIRSVDVSVFASAAEGLDVTKPLRPYHMDRDVLRNFYVDLADRWEAMDGYTKAVSHFRDAISSDAMIDRDAQEMEQFAMEHSLWAVPPHKLTTLYLAHIFGSEEPE